MNCSDAIFDGVKLSDQGFMSASFSDDDTINAGSNIEFTHTFNGENWLKTDAKYSEQLTFNFSIIKNPCEPDYKVYFTREDIGFVMRWFVRKEYCLFHPLEDGHENLYYNCVFKATERMANGQVIGFDLEGTCDAPFGYGEEISINLYNSSSIQQLYDSSDEIGSTVPYIEATCVNNGDIEIQNCDTKKTTIVKNCKANEVITFYPDYQITSSTNRTDLAKSFNYCFFEFGNTLDNRVTDVNVTNCNLLLKYRPKRKGGV